MLEPTDLFDSPPTNDREKVAQNLATGIAWSQFRASIRGEAASTYAALMECLPEETVCEE